MGEEPEEEKETIYDEGGREELGEDDEITPEEQAFMHGYEAADEREEEKEEEKDKGKEEETESEEE